MVTFAISLLLSGLMLAAGIRVLVATCRAGGTTEQLVGAAFVLMGLGGIPGLLAGHGDVFAPAMQPTVFCVGQLLLSGALSCLYLFTWRCFGATTPWRRVLALAGVGTQLGGFIALGVIEGYDPRGGDVIRLVALSRAGVMVWAFAESYRYWRLMQRRHALGLVDPVVTNRFALWACWTGGLVVGAAAIVTARFTHVGSNLSIDFTDPLDSALIATAFASMLTSLAALTLAFLPPAGYLRWIRRRARTA